MLLPIGSLMLCLKLPVSRLGPSCTVAEMQTMSAGFGVHERTHLRRLAEGTCILLLLLDW